VAQTTREQPTALASKRSNMQWTWVSIALGAHAAWGLYPVLARYLQTESLLPTFSILALGNLFVLLTAGRYLWRNTELSAFRMPLLWLFGLIVVLRATTNIASARYTLSIYVQLITQATPFIVILMSTLLFREKLPRFTIPAVILSVIGAVLMVGSDFGGGVANDPTRQDWLGVGLAMTSVIMLSTYMVLVRRTVTTATNISGEALLLVQLVSIIVVTGAMSLFRGEDWTQYTRIGATDWAIMLAFSFVVFLGANLGQIQAIRQLGAPFVSSLLASRLISALIFGGLLLGEQLQSMWQVLGAGIVAVTITWYLWKQR
jgi:drug/metabolite transporter (DMT)-like permease